MMPDRWTTEEEAFQEAKRRNEGEAFRSSGFWIETQLPSGDWTLERRKRVTMPLWRRIAGGLAIAVGLYAFLGLLQTFNLGYLFYPEGYEVGQCLDAEGDKRTCSSPEAVVELVREADTPAQCRATYRVEDWLPVFPWVPEDGFCAHWLAQR
jgi:hypothetical protein